MCVNSNSNKVLYFVLQIVTSYRCFCKELILSLSILIPCSNKIGYIALKVQDFEGLTRKVWGNTNTRVKC